MGGGCHQAKGATVVIPRQEVRHDPRTGPALPVGGRRRPGLSPHRRDHARSQRRARPARRVVRAVQPWAGAGGSGRLAPARPGPRPARDPRPPGDSVRSGAGPGTRGGPGTQRRPHPRLRLRRRSDPRQRCRRAAPGGPRRHGGGPGDLRHRFPLRPRREHGPHRPDPGQRPGRILARRHHLLQRRRPGHAGRHALRPRRPAHSGAAAGARPAYLAPVPAGPVPARAPPPRLWFNPPP